MTRPKYNEDLLPAACSLVYHYYNRGGRGNRTITIASVLLGTEIVATGHAICAPRDRFNKALGQTIASGRAVKNFIERPNTP